MKDSLPAALQAHLRGDALSTALLWRITKNDGTQILGTDHDRDLTIPAVGSPIAEAAGTYLAGSNVTGSQVRSTSDLAVDNMNVEGAIPVAYSHVVDVTVQDIEAGLLDSARVQIFLCNWERPEDGAMTVKSGYLGDISRDSDGRYSTEIRGLAQLLAQNFVRTYSERCEVRRFGDEECKVDVPALAQTGTVTAVTSRRRFDSTITGGRPAGYFTLGLLRFTSGLNAGFTREVRRDDEGDVVGAVSTWDIFPDTIAPGDTFEVTPGCDRLAGTCKTKYSNLLNFRGYGIFIEGMDALMRGPT